MANVLENAINIMTLTYVMHYFLKTVNDVNISVFRICVFEAYVRSITISPIYYHI